MGFRAGLELFALFSTHGEISMNKILSSLILAAFAVVAFNANAASHAGAAPMKASEPAAKASAPAKKASAPAKKASAPAKKASAEAVKATDAKK
jgi:hypothetical protein